MTDAMSSSSEAATPPAGTRDIVEIVARAICRRKCLRGDILGEPCFDPVTHRNTECGATRAQLLLSWRHDAAKAVLSALSQRGMVMVPRQANDKMVDAVWRNARFGASKDRLLDMWSAMISAWEKMKT